MQTDLNDFFREDSLNAGPKKRSRISGAGKRLNYQGLRRENERRVISKKRFIDFE